MLLSLGRAVSLKLFGPTALDAVVHVLERTDIQVDDHTYMKNMMYS